MRKPRFSVTQKDEFMAELVNQTDQKILAAWAMDCVERVISYFEDTYPEDNRPRNAIESLHDWLNIGMFAMADIRKAALGSHAAARAVGEDNAARSAARAAGQAVATAHVPAHSIGAAMYALQAIHRSADSADADSAVARERTWQYNHLLELRK
jgi:hypothetical protein